MFRCGFVAVLGRPNAGKSSLINHLVGMKIAIVSPKPQTTRDNILAILTTNDTQMIFIDTPGLHKATSHLGKYMMKNVRTAKAEADVVLYMVDSSVGLENEEAEHINKMKQDGLNVVVGASKVDKKQPDFDHDIAFSSLTGENISKLLEILKSFLPCSKTKNFMFDEDEVTDKPTKFIVAEYIREAVLSVLKKEVPHGVAVVINNFDETNSLAKIETDIVCEKQSHKGIIIGKGGETLKKIGTIARKQAEMLLMKKVMLSIFVKVESDWKNKPNKLSNLGYKNE